MSRNTARLIFSLCALGLLALLLALAFGMLFPDRAPAWLGTAPVTDSGGRLVQPGKTLWDLLELFIVPLALALIAFGFNALQARREQDLQDNRTESEVLQRYIDKMSELILGHNLMESDRKSAPAVLARTLTRTTVYRLSPAKKAAIVRFLKDAALVEASRTVVSLAGCDLRNAALHKMGIQALNFSNANLMGADLNEAWAEEANFAHANLTGASLRNGDFKSARFAGANLTETDLTRADFAGADLSKANLRAANLSGANLQADLTAVRLDKARYDASTRWPKDFDPAAHGASG